jgi:hypothetical protein
MEPRDSPYVFRDEPSEPASPDPEERDVVIVDGRAMSYRRYRRYRGSEGDYVVTSSVDLDLEVDAEDVRSVSVGTGAGTEAGAE